MNYVLRLPQAKTFWRFLQRHKAKVSGKKLFREKTELPYDNWIAMGYKFWKKNYLLSGLIIGYPFYYHTDSFFFIIQ